MFSCKRCETQCFEGPKCGVCLGQFDFPCSGITEVGWRKLGERKNTWKCTNCKTLTPSSPRPTTPSLERPSTPQPADMDAIMTELRSLSNKMINLPSLIEDVKAIKLELVELKSMRTEFASLKSGVEFLDHSIGTLSAKVTDLEHEVDSLKISKVTVSALQERCSTLEDMYRDSEQRARFNNLEIKGVPLTNTENLFDIISKIGWLLLLSSVAGLRTLEPPAPAAVSRNQVVEGWLPVRLNHFDASNTETFQMRYFYNPDLKNATSQTHIVIFVGGEWAISTGWVQAGLTYDLASEIGAGLFYTEHRYYGMTRPSRDTSVENLRYLNVDQAVGDLVQFIQHVKSDDFEGGYYRNATVSLVGCSYAGSMATWARLGYPHLVTAAFSDSGPLRAQEDFPEYLEVITEALRSQGGQACVDAVGEALDMMLELITTTAGVQRVSELFKTCSLLQASSPLDVATFFWFGITETFAYLVQYATPGDIPAACDVITGSQGDPVERLSTWITSQAWTQPCIESRYQEVLAAHTNTSYDAPDSVMRLWTYQTCVEYGWYQTTTSSHQPFRDTVPLEYFHQMCRDFFGVLFTPTFLRAGISRTNLLWGSQLPHRVVSVAGGADPWSPVGPNVTDAHQHAPVYVVDGVSHCRAVRPLGDSETEELEKTKQAVLEHMVYWTTGRSIPSGAAGLTASMLLVAIALLVQ